MTTPTEHHQHLEAIAEKRGRELGKIIARIAGRDISLLEAASLVQEQLDDALTEATQPLVEESEKVKGANARHVINHIESICAECGHIKGEDGCANCLQIQHQAVCEVVVKRDREVQQLQSKLAEAQKDKERLDRFAGVETQFLEDVLYGNDLNKVGIRKAIDETKTPEISQTD